MQFDESKRIILLAIAAAIAALPLVWFAVDANAGDKLLRMTSPAPTIAPSATQGTPRN
ncbi:MAG: hypothetical protein ACK50D_07235 [Burkholderiales bacterium]|jgi:hypothetical protein|nr:hypothetical protein [Nitrosomonadaceae bacterium]